MSARTTHLGATVLIVVGFIAIVFALAMRPGSASPSDADLTPIVGPAAAATP